jgi:biotin operon repressor
MRATRDSSLDKESCSLCFAVCLRENGDTQETYASIRLLAADSKLSRATVFRRLQKLILDGVIIKKTRSGQTSILSLRLPALERFRRAERLRRDVVSRGDHSRLRQRRAPSHRETTPVSGRDPISSLNCKHNSPVISPRRQHPESAPEPAKDGDDFLHSIFQKLLQDFPMTSPERLAWAVHLVRSRAKTAPRTLAYFRRALPGVFENLHAEVASWLTGEARHRLRKNGNAERLPDLAEDLKSLAAQNGLPYSGELIGEVIDCAHRKLENERHIETEIHVGVFCR